MNFVNLKAKFDETVIEMIYRKKIRMQIFFCKNTEGVCSLKTRLTNKELSGPEYIATTYRVESHNLNLIVVKMSLYYSKFHGDSEENYTVYQFYGFSKRRNIMKSKLNVPAENQLEFDLFYDEDVRINFRPCRALFVDTLQ